MDPAAKANDSVNHAMIIERCRKQQGHDARVLTDVITCMASLDEMEWMQGVALSCILSTCPFSAHHVSMTVMCDVVPFPSAHKYL